MTNKMKKSPSKTLNMLLTYASWIAAVATLLYTCRFVECVAYMLAFTIIPCVCFVRDIHASGCVNASSLFANGMSDLDVMKFADGRPDMSVGDFRRRSELRSNFWLTLLSWVAILWVLGNI